jgi:hypothetical protein
MSVPPVVAAAIRGCFLPGYYRESLNLGGNEQDHWLSSE